MNSKSITILGWLLMLVFTVACKPITSGGAESEPVANNRQENANIVQNETISEQATVQSTDSLNEVEPETVEGDINNQTQPEVPATADGVVQPDLTTSTNTSDEPVDPMTDSVVYVDPDQITPNAVSLWVSALTYQPGEVISVVVVNGFDKPIYTHDMKSDCKIVTLERFEAEIWQPLAGCGMERMAFTTTLLPGEGYQVTLDPLSTHFSLGTEATQSGIPAGTYRILFTYSFESGQDTPELEAVYSDVFQISES